MTPIKIAIADDYKIYRDGLKLCLSADENLQFLFEAENGQELMQSLEEQQPDVILMDLKMPLLDGVESTKIIREKFPQIKVLVVTMYESDKFIIHLMENGANGYLLKNAVPKEIIKAIYTVHENGYYFNDLVNKALLKKLVMKNNLVPSFNEDVELSEQEHKVLQLICEEKTVAEIGAELSLSPRYIEGIREKLIEKVGVRNTAGLVMFAVKNGMAE
jgi:DNA-binding NarL/FixJ family response regulator